MTSRKSYSRYFIILQEDEKGYALASDKLPSGYAKLEIKNDKCRISYYVQNLKKSVEPYSNILVCSKRDEKKLVKLGNMNIDEFGRADISYEYSISEAEKMGIIPDNVSGASIMKLSSGDATDVMSGFTGSDIPQDWTRYSIIDIDTHKENKDTKPKVFNENIKAQIKKQVNEVKSEFEAEADDRRKNKNDNSKSPEVKQLSQIDESVENKQNSDNESKSNMFDEYEENIESIKKEKEDNCNHYHEDYDENYHADYDENHHEDHHEDHHDDKHENHDEDHHEEHHKDHCEYDDYDENYDYYAHEDNYNDHQENHHEDHHDKHDSVSEFFIKLSKGFEEVTDTCSDIKRVKWYKVHVNDMSELMNTTDYNKYTVAYYPMMVYYPYIKKNGHFLLGYKHDSSGKVKYIVYGIPGRKIMEDQPFLGKSGFVTWISFDNSQSDMGYWLMFYDFKNSVIVIPVK